MKMFKRVILSLSAVLFFLLIINIQTMKDSTNSNELTIEEYFFYDEDYGDKTKYLVEIEKPIFSPPRLSEVREQHVRLL